MTTCSYLQVHDMMRNISGVGEGNGPWMSIHDGFQGVSSWSDFMRGSDRIALDTHPYFAFGGGPATDPIATGFGLEAGGTWPQAACNRWAVGMNGRYADSSHFFLLHTKIFFRKSIFFWCNLRRGIQQRLQRLWIVPQRCVRSTLVWWGLWLLARCLSLE